MVTAAPGIAVNAAVGAAPVQVHAVLRGKNAKECFLPEYNAQTHLPQRITSVKNYVYKIKSVANIFQKYDNILNFETLFNEIKTKYQYTYGENHKTCTCK